MPPQARRDAQLLLTRAAQLGQEAERKAEGAVQLMRRAAEKAADSVDAKAAAQQATVRRCRCPSSAGAAANAVQPPALLPPCLPHARCAPLHTPPLPPPPAQGEGGGGGGGAFGGGMPPFTPGLSAEARRLAAELDAVQRGRMAAQLHAAQLVDLGHSKAEHAGLLEHAAERAAAHVQVVLADAAAARTQARRCTGTGRAGSAAGWELGSWAAQPRGGQLPAPYRAASACPPCTFALHPPAGLAGGGGAGGGAGGGRGGGGARRRGDGGAVAGAD